MREFNYSAIKNQKWNIVNANRGDVDMNFDKEPYLKSLYKEELYRYMFISTKHRIFTRKCAPVRKFKLRSICSMTAAANIA